MESSLFLYKKHNGTLRFLTDYRGLNLNLERNPCPLERIEDTIHSLSKFSWASVLDMPNGYYAMHLDKDSQNVTGITLPWGTYVYTRLPQGLVNSINFFKVKLERSF